MINMNTADNVIKKNRSLTTRMKRTTVVGCLVLGLSTLILSLGLYGKTLIRQYADQAFEVAEHVASSVTMGADSIPLSKDIMAADKELFGTKRMLTALNKDMSAGLKETLDNVREVVDDFVKDVEQFDDLTMLVLEYRDRQ